MFLSFRFFTGCAATCFGNGWLHVLFVVRSPDIGAKKSLRTTGAVLVVSKGMKRAVVPHPTGKGDFKQAIVISDAAVHMMVLQSTVRPIAHGRITKYVLSEAADGSLPIEAAARVRLVDPRWKIWPAAKIMRGVHFQSVN